MTLRKLAVKLSITCLLIFSSLLQAQENLVYVLWSLNSRAEISLVQRQSDGNHKPLAYVTRDMTEDEAYLDHSGNIAVFKKNEGKNAASVARKMVQEILTVQEEVLKEENINPKEATFSFMYAVAGVDAADGEYLTQYSPVKSRAIENQARIAIDEAFTEAGITLSSLMVSRDSGLIGEAMKLKDPEPHLVVFKTTYDMLFYQNNGSVVTLDVRANKIPSGSTHYLGAMTYKEYFSPMEEPQCSDGSDTCSKQQSQWSQAPVFKSLLADAINEKRGTSYTTEDLQVRFGEDTRRNELGDAHLLLLLAGGKQPPEWLTAFYQQIMSESLAPTFTKIENKLPIIQQQLHDQGITTKPRVYYMGDCIRINRDPFVSAQVKKHAADSGYDQFQMTQEETRELIGRAGVYKHDMLIKARQ